MSNDPGPSSHLLYITYTLEYPVIIFHVVGIWKSFHHLPTSRTQFKQSVLSKCHQMKFQWTQYKILSVLELLTRKYLLHFKCSQFKHSNFSTNLLGWTFWGTHSLSRVSGSYRRSHQRCSMKKGVLRNFAELTGKHLCQSLVFDKVAGLSPTTFLKKRL